MKNKNTPEWVPDNANSNYTTSVMPGLDKNIKQNINIHKKKELSIEDLFKGIIKQDITILSKAITLIESNAKRHFNKGQELLKRVLPYTGKSIRIGITGSPGAGKSTMIENLGSKLCDNGMKIAVLAIDPSSSITKGSILGDKTRMEMLSRKKNAFIRPSPSSGTLGGVTRKTRETMLLCEAAGFDVIIIETVGVGQNEISVRSIVDFFLLVLLPGAGDELQGIKKGVVELADTLIVNKADSNNKIKANLTQRAYANSISMLTPATEGWKTQVLTCSAVEDTGIWELWTNINEFRENVINSGYYYYRRKHQTLEWVETMLQEGIMKFFYDNSELTEKLENYKQNVLDGDKTPTQAVNEMLVEFSNILTNS